MELLSYWKETLGVAWKESIDVAGWAPGTLLFLGVIEAINLWRARREDGGMKKLVTSLKGTVAVALVAFVIVFVVNALARAPQIRHANIVKERDDFKQKLQASTKRLTLAFPLGGSATEFKKGPVDAVNEVWTPVAGFQDVVIDWPRHENYVAAAEVMMWVRNAQNTGDFRGMARIWNVTDGVSVASTLGMYEDETPTRLTLDIPSERARKVYRLEVKPSAYALVTASGELVLRPR